MSWPLWLLYDTIPTPSPNSRHTAMPLWLPSTSCYSSCCCCFGCHRHESVKSWDAVYFVSLTQCVSVMTVQASPHSSGVVQAPSCTGGLYSAATYKMAAKWQVWGATDTRGMFVWKVNILPMYVIPTYDTFNWASIYWMLYFIGFYIISKWMAEATVT